MNFMLPTTSLLVACFLGTSAMAHSAIDAEVALDYISAPDDSFEYQVQLTGSVERRFGQFGVQSDLLIYQYEGETNTSDEITLHAFYEVTPGLDVGLAYTWGGNLESNWGSSAYIEANYSTGANAIEGFYGAEGGGLANSYGIKYTRDFGVVGPFDGLEVFAGYNSMEVIDDDETITNPYIGADFAVGNGFVITSRYASMDDGDYRYITLGVTKTFGAGTTFSGRGFGNLFPGY
jgi:hypothetical protein